MPTITIPLVSVTVIMETIFSKRNILLVIGVIVAAIVLLFYAGIFFSVPSLITI